MIHCDAMGCQKTQYEEDKVINNTRYRDVDNKEIEVLPSFLYQEEREDVNKVINRQGV